MYSLNTLWAEAERCGTSLKQECDKTKSYIKCGSKILYDKPTETIILLNLTRGGEWFSEMKDSEYQVFLKYGWSVGVYKVALKNYSRKLLAIETMIKGEINTRKNEKRFRKLKASRKRYLNKYAEVKKKINLLLTIKKNNYGNNKQNKLLY